jgi:pimeloyl-ACP methyl ester carboxylesterase
MDSFTRDGLRFDVVDAGPPDAAETVVLLHGFPQSAASWAGVSGRLAEAGLRVLAFDQRGYSPGARPLDKAAYRMEELVADVLALADAAGLDRFHVVGHDWGGGVAWALGADPAAVPRLASLTVLSMPHPRAFAHALLRSGQALRSAYVALFRTPVVAERLLLAGGGLPLRRGLRRSGLDAATARAYAERMAQPGALTAALNWYRAARNPSSYDPVDPAVPTLYVWSTGDTALGRAAAEGTAQFVPGPYRFEVLDGLSHWLPEQAPDAIAALIAAHAKGV